MKSNSAGLCSSEWGSKNALNSAFFGKSMWLPLSEEVVMLSSPWIFPRRLNLLLIFHSHYWNLLNVAFEQSRVVVDGLDESWLVKHVAFSKSSVGLELYSLPGPCAVLYSVCNLPWKIRIQLFAFNSVTLRLSRGPSLYFGYLHFYFILFFFFWGLWSQIFFA